ncbi:NVEALA domain-containing protein [Xylanibacter rodentium]|uniref:NVEALA domain-containing protein n=1 Tax=Xylanibacter rodentium TaxID=2736289 RepID=UPI00259D14AF|nr:NVEALA domain-containing protein [Xylanibacter rodentium]
MKKKIAIGIGVSIILITLFINLFFQNNNEKVKLTFNNIEALAEGEEPEVSTPGVTCVEKGAVCMGVNSNGEIGKFPGLITKG